MVEQQLEHVCALRTWKGGRNPVAARNCGGATAWSHSQCRELGNSECLSPQRSGSQRLWMNMEVQQLEYEN